ncbi:type III-B CRISPR module-associated protein Cmr3 [Marinitoga sp. 1155]|uniref:type III-B CRISPR module-associated protein Cmr3 n=1 Tax=Marinitoga sp. 1155 TaxID=1428448 RepID=UPI0006414F9D|nr:type III-B CRISPR module-associated protein Cmr3 [Marinitoga sp. 1155]KLO23498.1 hypothetical protein X274_06275 [Marinitoga sp. 1155]
MIIEIEPLDTLFFKDGKPFSMGEETWAEGIFPPYPSTIYGALRSAYFANNINELNKAKEKDDPTKDLKIKGIYLKLDDDICFPVPLDCVKDKDKDITYTLKLKTKNNIISSYPKYLNFLLTANEKVENVSQVFFSDIDFEKYLNGFDEFFYSELKNYLFNEPKIGITRSKDTLSTEEGKIYRVDMYRTKNLKLVVDFENLEIPQFGFLKLGGESKSARYKNINKEISVEPAKFNKYDKCFKLVLTTPAIFKENGWIPTWIDKDTLEGVIGGLKVKLISASIGKPIVIGGFDIKEKKPKPSYKAVPTGSVYYFKLLEGNVNDIVNIFHENSISEIYSEQGFGICYVGKFNIEVEE